MIILTDIKTQLNLVMHFFYEWVENYSCSPLIRTSLLPVKSVPICGVSSSEGVVVSVVKDELKVGRALLAAYAFMLGREK